MIVNRLCRPAVLPRGISLAASWWDTPRTWLKEPRGVRSASSGGQSTSKGLSFKTMVKAGRTGRQVEVVSDMPPIEDPHDSAQPLPPSPKDLVMAGLAACTSMTIQNRAKVMVASGRLGEAALQQVLVRALDVCPEGEHMPQGVEVEVQLIGDLTPTQRRQLLAAAGACPVKKMLSGQMQGGVSSAEVPAGSF